MVIKNFFLKEAYSNTINLLINAIQFPKQIPCIPTFLLILHGVQTKHENQVQKHFFV